MSFGGKFPPLNLENMIRAALLILASALVFVGVVIASVWIHFHPDSRWVGPAMAGFFLVFVVATPVVRFLTHKRPAAVFVLWNALALLCLTFGFGLLVRPAGLPLAWVAMAVAAILFVQCSAMGFRQYHARLRKRLTATRVFSAATESFEDRLDSHSNAYYALPLGAVAGAIHAAISSASSPETIRLCLAGATGLLCLWLLVFLVREAFVIAASNVEERAQKGIASFVAANGVPKVALPDLGKLPDQQATAIDGVVVAADWRQLVLLNQYALLAMAMMSAAATLWLLNVRIGMSAVIAIALSAALLFVQVPFAIGQAAARRVVLDHYVGKPREALRKELNDVAPVSPPLHAWVGAFANGAGGILLGYLLKLMEGTVVPD